MILRAIKELTLDNIFALRGRETEETNTRRRQEPMMAPSTVYESAIIRIG